MAHKKKPATVTIEGWSIHVEKNVHGFIGQRIYEIDQVCADEQGVRSPLPNTWRPAQTVPFAFAGAEMIMPDVELPATVPLGRRGPLLYAMVLVDATGREYWHGSDSEFHLPAKLGPSISYYELIRFNLGLRGEELPPERAPF